MTYYILESAYYLTILSVQFYIYIQSCSLLIEYYNQSSTASSESKGQGLQTKQQHANIHHQYIFIQNYQ